MLGGLGTFGPKVVRVGVGFLCFSLSGCVAAALVPLAASVGAVGLSTYKLVQTESGGSVGVDYPKGPDGKVKPPGALAPAVRLAVWPGDESTVRFAEKLEQVGRFKVTAPATVTARLADVNVPADLNKMTDGERDGAFDIVCKRFGVELVFAERGRGIRQNTNMLSLSRATVTSDIDFLAYSCASHALVWTDHMTLVVGLSESHQPTNSELAEVAGDAWADRVMQAMGLRSGS